MGAMAVVHAESSKAVVFHVPAGSEPCVKYFHPLPEDATSVVKGSAPAAMLCTPPEIPPPVARGSAPFTV